MIVFYNVPNILYLPYTDKENQVREAKFVPGKNVIDSEIWEIICTKYKEDFRNYYSSCFKVLKPVREIKDTDMAVGENVIDVYKLTVAELRDLIENTMEISELVSYKEAENKEKQRKTVFELIDKQIQKVSSFTQKLQPKAKG